MPAGGRAAGGVAGRGLRQTTRHRPGMDAVVGEQAVRRAPRSQGEGAGSGSWPTLGQAAPASASLTMVTDRSAEVAAGDAGAKTTVQSGLGATSVCCREPAGELPCI